MEIVDLRKEIHNLVCQQYRIRQIQKDPEAFREKECKRHHEYYVKNKDRIQERTTEYRKSHRDWFNTYKRMLYARNKKK